MKSLSTILLAAALFSGANYTSAAPYSGVKVRSANVIQDRHLSGFHAIDASGSFDIYITQGSTESVKVDAPSDVIDRIVTEVEGGVLKIHDKHDSNWNWSSWWGNGHKKIAVHIIVRNLNSIGITGSGDVFFKDGIRSESLKLRLTGSGDVTGKLEVKTLESSISGSGDIKLAGHAENSTISVSGSGDFTAHDLVTVNTTVHVSGSGDASINASNSIDASVSGSGDVTYTGGAEHIVKTKSGSGDISRD